MILLPPIPDRGTHCDGCDRGYVRVASRADNGSRIDDSPTSLTDTAIRPPSLSYLSSVAVRFRYCPPSAVDSSLLQHYASVDDRNRIICSQCRRTLVPVPCAAASSGKRHPTIQGVPPEKQSIRAYPIGRHESNHVIQEHHRRRSVRSGRTARSFWHRGHV